MELSRGGDGQKWVFVQCIKCKYCDGAFCRKYNADRIDLPFSLLDCPGFEKDGTKEK